MELSREQQELLSCEAVCVASNGRPRLVKLFHVYPIRLFPIIHKSYVCLVAAGFGGGLVQGDRVSFRLEVCERCTVCFKTQGSTKVFKTVPAINGDVAKTCVQTLDCQLRADSFLVYVPDVIACFDDSRFRQSNSLQLHRTASLLYVDFFSSGRLVRFPLCSQYIFTQ